MISLTPRQVADFFHEPKNDPPFHYGTARAGNPSHASSLPLSLLQALRSGEMPIRTKGKSGVLIMRRTACNLNLAEVECPSDDHTVSLLTNLHPRVVLELYSARKFGRQ